MYAAIMLALTAGAAHAQAEAGAWHGLVGAGWERAPAWSGARQDKYTLQPYFDLTWHDRVELSSTDGLSVDLINAGPWHGGLVGTLTWGRSNSDLRELAGKVRTLSNTEQAGGYLEYAFREGVDAGLQLRHDLQGTGSAYGTVYADLGLPPVWGIKHQLSAALEFMNRRAMQRFYGLSASEGASLGSAAYAPAGGVARSALSYQAYLPINGGSGVVLGIEFARLRGAAAHGPLVAGYGDVDQRSLLLSYVLRY